MEPDGGNAMKGRQMAAERNEVSGRRHRGGLRMRKAHVFALLAVALIGVACGGGSEDTNPAAFGNRSTPTEVCQRVPANVPGVTIAGQRVESIERLEVCVQAAAAAGVVPSIKNQPQCGDPCMTLEITGLNASVDTGVKIKMTRDGSEQEVVHDIDPVAVGDSERWCLIGVGTPDPCVERITTPTGLKASPGKKAGVLKLAWGASTNTGDAGVTGYEVYRSETGDEGTFVPVGTSTSTSFAQTGLTSGTTYFYYVIALDGEGNHSEASNVAQGTPK
jgi:hypothetical protein